MHSDKPISPRNTQPAHGGRSPRLFYFERAGQRARLRFTRLAVILLICLIVVPATTLFVLFLLRDDPAEMKVDINVRTLPPLEAPSPPLIIQPPTPPPPKPVTPRSPVPAPSPPITPLASAETNARPAASPSPSGAQQP